MYFSSFSDLKVQVVDVDVDHAIHLLQRGLLERLRNGRTGIVHKDIQTAECRDLARACQTVLNRLVLYDDEDAARMQDY
jgi:hypothetical protein